MQQKTTSGHACNIGQYGACHNCLKWSEQCYAESIKAGCREGQLVLNYESESFMTYCWLGCKREHEDYRLRGIVLPLTPKYDMRWSFAARQTFTADPEFHVKPLDNLPDSVSLQLSLQDNNTDCPYDVTGRISAESVSRDTTWAFTANTAQTAHVLDLQALCSDFPAGYQDPLLLHDAEIWGHTLAEETDSEKVTVVMNPVHPFANSAAGELAVKILLYHIDHHFCLGIYDYLLYIEPAQARQLLQSEEVRALVQQNRLHLIVWDLPIVRPRKRKKDAFGSPTPAGIHFWQPAQYNHALLLLWGKSRYLMFIDIDEFLSAPIANVLQLNTKERHLMLLEQIQMYCQECGDSKTPESQLWKTIGPSQLLDKYWSKSGYAKLVNSDDAEVPGVIEKRHIKSIVHTDEFLVMHNHMPFLSPGDEHPPIFTRSTDTVYLAHFLNLWRFRSNSRFQKDNYTHFDHTFTFCGI